MRFRLLHPKWMTKLVDDGAEYSINLPLLASSIRRSAVWRKYPVDEPTNDPTSQPQFGFILAELCFIDHRKNLFDMVTSLLWCLPPIRRAGMISNVKKGRSTATLVLMLERRHDSLLSDVGSCNVDPLSWSAGFSGQPKRAGSSPTRLLSGDPSLPRDLMGDHSTPPLSMRMYKQFSMARWSLGSGRVTLSSDTTCVLHCIWSVLRQERQICPAKERFERVLLSTASGTFSVTKAPKPWSTTAATRFV